MSREQLVVERARRAFQTGMSKPLKFRVHQLKNLHRFITERRKDIAEAVKKDLNKTEHSTELFETLGLEGEIDVAVERLAEWAAPRPVEKSLLTILDEVYIQPEPLGVVLIIGPGTIPGQ
ncbi:aldehyde dehydrogenase family 3 member A2 [Salvelinus sp. IW2-2015]|uniref:aldehyde dehydrogenase family 3 member A2 n=1 Tax=Salvelinus sp. IW2-2015 TaxID=2691554 RepID=UPI000CEB31E8|nr:fatty aldehyde dehydrogenase-like [Salvelinus alpinus]